MYRKSSLVRKLSYEDGSVLIMSISTAVRTTTLYGNCKAQARARRLADLACFFARLAAERHGPS
jgi:hypothetical protein